MRRDRLLFPISLYLGLVFVGVNTTVYSPILIEISRSFGIPVEAAMLLANIALPRSCEPPTAAVRGIRVLDLRVQGVFRDLRAIIVAVVGLSVFLVLALEKDSGIGRAGSHYSVEEATDLKWITLQHSPRDYPPG